MEELILYYLLHNFWYSVGERFIHIKLHVSTGMRSTSALFKRDIRSSVRVIFVYWTPVFRVM